MNRERLRARLVIALDEWIGWSFVLFLHVVDSRLFLPAMFVHCVCTYIVSYPSYWGWYRPWGVSS